MSKRRRQHSSDLKAKVGLEALKGIEPVHAIAAKYQVHPVTGEPMEEGGGGAAAGGVRRKGRDERDAEASKEREKELFEEIGRLKMEPEWLKKKLRARALRSVAA